MLILVFFLIIAVFLPVSAIAADGKSTIVVGGDRDYPPYEFLDADGQATGFNVELTRAIAEVMGMKVDFRLGVWEKKRKALETGEIDLLQGLSYSEERNRIFDFTPPHSIVHHSIFARKGSKSVASLQELEGRVVALHKGGFMHEHIRTQGYRISLVTTATPADALRMLAAGTVDAAIVASLPGNYLINELSLTNIDPIAKSIAVVNYGHAVKKGNAELLAKVTEGLAIVKKTGRYQQIYNKWLGVLEPHGVQWSLIVKYGVIIFVPLLLVLIGTVAWSRMLRRQVAVRTADLEREVQEHKQTAEQLRVRQEQLVQADKMASLGILVSGVAHEINNPNGLILLTIPLIADAFQDARSILDEHYQEHGDFELGGIAYSRIRDRLPVMMHDMHEGSRRIKRIVEDLKDFARRDETGSTEVFDLNTVVQAAVRLVDTSTKKATSLFVTMYADFLPDVRGNAQRIEQVVVNLILNACQSLESPAAAVMLATSYDDDRGMVVFSVQDEGSGIAPEHIAHLTDPFFTTKRETGGTGLGLSVSAGIVKEHGGLLQFSSEPGRGTTATLSLPAENKKETS
jgi:polar amino acid transport system substrate-binding protein